METFMKIYAEQLALAVEAYPEQYLWPKENIAQVVNLMKLAIERKSFSKDSIAFQWTCKALKIKHTYKAIDHFIVNHR